VADDERAKTRVADVVIAHVSPKDLLCRQFSNAFGARNL